MKKSTVGIGVVTGVISVLSFVGIATAAQILPQITKVCEHRSGQIITYGDGFSIYKACPSNYRAAYITGEPGPKGDKGDQGVKGDSGTPGQGLDLTKVYTKIDGPFTATKGIQSTVAHGCNQGDLAIGGGLHSFSGNISNWQTIKSLPSITEPSDVMFTANGWSTTVLNNVENGSFYTLTRCIDLI